MCFDMFQPGQSFQYGVSEIYDLLGESTGNKHAATFEGHLNSLSVIGSVCFTDDVSVHLCHLVHEYDRPDGGK